MQSDPIKLERKKEELQLFYMFARTDKQLIEGKSSNRKSAQSLEGSRACNGGEIDYADQSSACVSA